MVKIILLLLALAVVFIGYPLLNEDTASPCSALALRAINEAGPKDNASSPVLNTLIVRLVGGPVTKEYAWRRNPNLPPFITCSALYWQTVIDPSSTGEVWADLRGSGLGGTKSTGNAVQPRQAVPPTVQDYPPPADKPQDRADQTAPPTVQDYPPPAYRQQDRADMDRLINQQQQQQQ